MKKNLLIITLLFFSLFLFVACISDRDHSNKEAELSKKTGLSIISATKVNGKDLVQVRTGNTIKIYDTLRDSNGIIYNHKGILNEIEEKTIIKNSKYAQNKNSSLFRPNGKWYINTENYINDGTGFMNCPFDLVQDSYSSTYPRFVSNIYGEEGDEMGELFWYNPIRHSLSKGPLIFETSSIELNKYLNCWYISDPVRVIVPYTNQTLE